MNTEVTPGQSSALENLNTAASGIPNFGASSSEAIKNSFNTAPQIGMLSNALSTLQGNLGGVAGGAGLNPYETPGFGTALQTMMDDITKSTKGVYAASGRAPSGAGSFAGSLARGLSQGIAPTIANQYNTNAARMDKANETLFGGAGSTAAGITGQNQSAANTIGLLPAAAGAATLPATTQLGAANATYQQPWTNLAALLNPVAGIAGLGGQSTGTGTSTTVQPQNTLSNVLGGGLSTVAMLSLLSDERSKTDIAPIGMLNDGQKIVRFRYKGDVPMRIGLLAQSVLDHEPEAVHNIGGMLAVDHKKATDRAAAMERAA